MGTLAVGTKLLVVGLKGFNIPNGSINSIGSALYAYVLLRQGSVTGVILVGRPDSLGFHSVTWLVGF